MKKLKIANCGIRVGKRMGFERTVEFALAKELALSFEELGFSPVIGNNKSDSNSKGSNSNEVNNSNVISSQPERPRERLLARR